MEEAAERRPNPVVSRPSWFNRIIGRFHPKSQQEDLPSSLESIARSQSIGVRLTNLPQEIGERKDVLILKPPPSTEPPLTDPLAEEREAIAEAEARLTREEELRSLCESISEYCTAIAAKAPERTNAEEEQYSFTKKHGNQMLEKYVQPRFYKQRKDGSFVKDYTVVLAQEGQRSYDLCPRIVVNMANGNPSSLFFYWHNNVNHEDRDYVDTSPLPVLGLPKEHPLAMLMSYVERRFQPDYSYSDSRSLYLSFELQFGNIAVGGKPGSIILRASKSAYDLTTFGCGLDQIKSKKHNFDAPSGEFKLEDYYGGGTYIRNLPYHQTLQIIHTLLSYIPTERVV